MKNPDLSSAKLDILENELGITNFDQQNIENSEGKIALAGLKQGQNTQEDLQKVIKYISNLDDDIDRLLDETAERSRESTRLSEKIKEKRDVIAELFSSELLKIKEVAELLKVHQNTLEEKRRESLTLENLKKLSDKDAILLYNGLDDLRSVYQIRAQQAKSDTEREDYEIKLHRLESDILKCKAFELQKAKRVDSAKVALARADLEDAKADKIEQKRRREELVESAPKKDKQYLKEKTDKHTEFLGTLDGRSSEDKRALFLAHFLKESAEIYVQNHNSRADRKLPIKQKFEVLLTSNEDPVIKEVVGELKGSLDTYIARMDKTLGSELGKYGVGKAYRDSILPNSPYIKTAAKLKKLAEVKTKEEKISLAAKAYKAIKDLFGNPISIFKKARSESINSEKYTLPKRSSSSASRDPADSGWHRVSGSASESRDSFSSRYGEFSGARTNSSVSEPETVLVLENQSRSYLDQIKRRYTKSQVISSAKSLGIGNAKTLLRATKPSRERV